MPKLEILVTTMHQNDFSKYKAMNLQSSAIIANQADFWGYSDFKIDGKNVRMLTTQTRGLSRNRNIALAMSTAEYVLFSDDDVVFYDGYERMIADEFAAHPEADAIRFEMHVVAIATNKKFKKISTDEIPKIFRKATRRELSQHGVCGLVVKRSFLQEHALIFNESFGAGTANYCGEDTIFMQSMLRHGAKFYLSPIIIADIDKSETTWFQGYDERYFCVAGKIIAACYSRLAYLLVIRSAYRFSKRLNNMKFSEILSAYQSGVREYMHHGK